MKSPVLEAAFNDVINISETLVYFFGVTFTVVVAVPNEKKMSVTWTWSVKLLPEVNGPAGKVVEQYGLKLEAARVR